MTANSASAWSDFGEFRLSSWESSNHDGLDTTGSPQRPILPPPPCVEVFPTEAPPSHKFATEPVQLGNLTLLKGRVSTKEVFTLSDSDLIPGIYEGGLKLWECSLDLIKALSVEIEKGFLDIKGKRVLEIGCGHGLPGIFTFIKGAANVHYQDFNAEVLHHLTIPNVRVNLPMEFETLKSSPSDSASQSQLRFFAGDWREIHDLLIRTDCAQYLSCASKHDAGTYDVILMAETVYAISNLQHLYELVKKCIYYPNGVIYMAAKKHYFGVGGGTRRFLSLVENDGLMHCKMVAEVADGSSNVREVWRLTPK